MGNSSTASPNQYNLISFNEKKYTYTLFILSFIINIFIFYNKMKIK